MVIRISRDDLYSKKGCNTPLDKISKHQLKEPNWNKLAKHLAQIAVHGLNTGEAQDASLFSAVSTEGQTQ